MWKGRLWRNRQRALAYQYRLVFRKETPSGCPLVTARAYQLVSKTAFPKEFWILLGKAYWSVQMLVIRIESWMETEMERWMGFPFVAIRQRLGRVQLLESQQGIRP